MEHRIPRCVTLLLLVMPGGIATAAEVVDQANEPTPADTAWTNLVPANGVGQTFTPTLDNLTAVEILVLTTGNTGSDVERLTASVWESRGTSPLGEASVDVDKGFDGWLRFEFSPAITLTPGQKVMLRVEDEGFVTFGWRYGGNAYARGARLFQLAPIANTDFFFHTFGESDRCAPTAERLCLGENDRFALEVTWRTTMGNTGTGKALDIGKRDSGLFYFFNEDNVEMLVKVLRGCDFNNHYWVFFAATTNVEFTIVVTDTTSKESRTYMNPLGKPADAVTDIGAFATCP